MEPRPRPTRENTIPLRSRSLGARRQRERVVGFEEAPNREGSRAGRNAEGNRPLEIKARENGKRGMNLPLLLAAHLGRNESDQPLQSSLTSVYKGHQPSTNIGEISLLTAQNGNPLMREPPPIIHKGGKTSKDQRSPPGTITEDKEDQILPFLRRSWARHKSVPGIKAPDRRSSKIRAASPFGKRNKEEKEKMSDTQMGEWKIGGKTQHLSKPPFS
ncbi:hypothetical protein Tco_0707083 [Tanacetum coccineum]|uniref:Uncharacterized protein n=1 Tax=Tanacetum coccineum TaxID=301880 RepID=A0ABQ4YAT4_9ASTR